MSGPDQAGGAGALYDAWRKLAAPGDGDIAHLRSATLEGVPIEPLYPRPHGVVAIPMRNGRPWIIMEILDQSSPAAAHEAARRALAEGAGGLALRFAGTPSEPALPVSRTALEITLASLGLDGVSLRLEPSLRSAEIAGLILDIAAAQSATAAAGLSFGLNPVALSAAGGEADIAKIFAGSWRRLADARPVDLLAEADGRSYHEAGAGEVLELAAILAEAAFTLRVLEAVGVAPDSALDALGASVAVDHDQFLSIAKLRALRLLFARLREVTGAPPRPLRVHAETSCRALTARDPHGNLVRATVAAFAAGAGGADSIGIAPFDTPLGEASPAARRLARNTQHLLLDEANTYRVADPAAGSGAIEALTQTLCERAWTKFRAIEADGGVLASLEGGALAKGLAEARAARVDAMATGRQDLVGVTVYAADDVPAPLPLSTPIHPALAPMRLEAAAQP